MIKPTKRQMQCIKLIAEGLSSKEIAKRLDIAERTVKMHISIILHRLGFKNRTQLLVKAVKVGWIK